MRIVCVCVVDERVSRMGGKRNERKSNRQLISIVYGADNDEGVELKQAACR